MRGGFEGGAAVYQMDVRGRSYGIWLSEGKQSSMARALLDAREGRKTVGPKLRA